MTTKTTMPQDGLGASIPMLTLKPDGAHAVTASAASAINDTPFADTTLGILVQNDVDVYLRQTSNASADAANTDSFLMAGSQVALSVQQPQPTGALPYLAVVRAGDDDGTVHISELV